MPGDAMDTYLARRELQWLGARVADGLIEADNEGEEGGRARAHLALGERASRGPSERPRDAARLDALAGQPTGPCHLLVL
jgi:hypothetical protein